MSAEHDHDELDALRTEVARLRALVGPSEESYAKLQLDLLGARDAAIGAESELGVVRAHNHELETEVVRLQRDFAWLREGVFAKLDALRRGRPRVRRVMGKLSSR